MISDDQIRLLAAQELKVSPELLQPGVALHALPGFDSVQLLMLMVALEEIGVKMPVTEAANLRTFGDILALERV
jgi:acyl carrier protein